MFTPLGNLNRFSYRLNVGYEINDVFSNLVLHSCTIHNIIIVNTDRIKQTMDIKVTENI
jgi:hypothetical protein